MRVLRLSAVLMLAGLTVTAAPAPPPDPGEEILGHVSDALSWYQNIQAADKNIGDSSDVFYLENARAQAGQAVRLAFELAQAQVSLLTPEAPPESAGSERSRNLQKAAERIAGRIADCQQQVAELEEEIKKAPVKEREDLRMRRDEVLAELDLAKAQQEAIAKILSFQNGTETTKAGLQGRLDQLKASVPEAFATKPETKPTSADAAPPTDTGGLGSQASLLFSQLRGLRDVSALQDESKQLSERVAKIEGPLRDQLRSTLKEGRELTDAPLGTQREEIDATRKKVEALTAKFKLVSAGTVPLRQETMVLEQARGNLGQWHASISKEYKRVLRSLVLRAVTLFAALAILLGFSEVWRRVTIRYVSEPRRRRQLLILRKFVTGFLVMIVVVLGFVSEIGSLATFAGFLTAGIAVALQTVILSVAAYFFLVGRYGLKVGDRITVGGVTGDVMDVGLVRLYLMELAGNGVDSYPTGRVVVFSNSVLFQSTPLFKQIPGTEFAWREVAVPLNPAGNHAQVEKAMLEAVNKVYGGYKESIERQHGAVERLIDVRISVPTPSARLQFTEAGLEALVRYPVEIRRSSELDDQVTRGVIDAVGKNAELKASVAGMPRIRSPIRV